MKKNSLIQFFCLLFFIVIILLPLPAQADPDNTAEKQFGNVDGNRTINIVDALMTAQYAVGLYPRNFDANTADVNWDGNVDIVDALMIARYAVGLISRFRADDVYADYQTRLDRAREQWNDLGLDYYEFVQIRSCFCINGGIPFIIEVMDDTIISVVNQGDGQPLPDDQAAWFRTVDDLFGEIQAAINRKYLILDLQFDPVYTYPSSVSIDYIKLAIDDEMAWSNSALRALRRTVITDLPPADLQDDPFSLDAAFVTGEILSTSVMYSGGCVEHGYTLYARDAFMESYPVQINCYLSHDGRDDMCDAIVSDDPCFDLSPIGELYEEMYRSKDTIIINLYGYFSGEPGRAIRLRYDPL